MNNVISYAIFAALEAAICASAACVMVKGKNGWGWLIAIAILILLCTRITKDGA